ncbi:MAG: phosphate/phosphite/phosphonate ABC transporter substrate-binding protein, partial [Chitinophagaceae bacterium]
YQYAENNRIHNIEPFAKHLQTKYGIQVSVKSYPTVHAFIEGIQKNEVDVALINTFGYLLLQTSQKKHAMQPLYTLNVREDARDNYKTAFIAPSNSSIHAIEDISKHATRTKLALVAPGSTSGNLVPRLALSRLGIRDPEKQFAHCFYAGNHTVAIEKILSKEADLACLGYTAYEKVIQDSATASRLKLVWISPEIPLGPVMVHRNIDAETKKIIGQALLSLHDDNPAAIESIKEGWSEAKQADRYIEITDAYYDKFRKTFGRRKDLQRILVEFAN